LTRQASLLLDGIRQNECEGERQAEGLPLAGRVAAGVPTEAIENYDRISLQNMFGGGDGVFALEVSGDSMIDEGIETGDVVICKKATEAQNGQMVVAIVDDENATLKRFYKEDSHARLEASNDAYEAIISDNCRIEGVVLGHLRRL